MKNILKFTVAIFIYILASDVRSAPVDLSSWQINGSGSWSFNSTNGPNDSADQALNSIPTVLFNNKNSRGTTLSGTVEVQTTSDDDFIGFVLGYNDNDLSGTNTSTDYILVDWKQNTQAGWGAGMSISRVAGGPLASSGTDIAGDAWTHTGNVNFLQRAATLGNIGWTDNTEYFFSINFTATNIQLSIDGIQQFDINGTFKDGSFGFYNFSQPNVRYAAVETVPIPAAFWLLPSGLIGLFGLARRA